MALGVKQGGDKITEERKLSCEKYGGRWVEEGDTNCVFPGEIKLPDYYTVRYEEPTNFLPAIGGVKHFRTHNEASPYAKYLADEPCQEEDVVVEILNSAGESVEAWRCEGEDKPEHYPDGL